MLLIYITIATVCLFFYIKISIKEYYENLVNKTLEDIKSSLKVGQIWRKDICTQPLDNPFRVPKIVNMEVLDISGNYVQYKVEEEIESTSIVFFLFGAELVRNVE